MPDGGTTRRNCKNRCKREWYAIYRSSRIRSRFGCLQQSRAVVIDTAFDRLVHWVAEANQNSALLLKGNRVSRSRDRD